MADVDDIKDIDATPSLSTESVGSVADEELVEVNEEYIFEFRTVQSSAFRVLIEALKEILTDANFIIDATGIKLMAMDPSHTILVHLKLEAEQFEYYKCEKSMTIGLNMLNLFKLIKTMNNSDYLSFFIDRNNNNKLGIKINNCDKKVETVYFLNLMDLQESQISIPPAVFESVITIPSSDFQKLMRDMTNIGEIVEIKSIGEQLQFSCFGDFASQETIMQPTQHGIHFVKNEDPSLIIQGQFPLKFLILFTKCTNLCNSIELYIKNDYPLIIRYKVANLGEIKLCLAPIATK